MGGLIRVRIGLLTAMAAVLALAAGRIFDETRPVVMLGALVPGLAAMAAAGHRRLVQASIATVSVIVASAATAAITRSVTDSGEGAGSLVRLTVDAFVSGPRRVLSTEWPSPAVPELVAAVTAGVAVCTAVACIVASHSRWRLTPLVPLAVLLGAIVATSAPSGPILAWLIPLAVLGPAFAAAGTSGATTPVRAHVNALLGERRGVVMSACAVVVAAAVSIPLALPERADPRTPEPALSVAPLVDPIEAVVALRSVDPPIELFRVTMVVDSGRPDMVPVRWRTAALTAYDGRRWSPGVTLAPIGRRLGPDRASMLTAEVEYLTGGLGEVPLPGPPAVIDRGRPGGITTDAQRSMVHLVERPGPGTRVRVTTGPAPLRASADSGPIATRPVGEVAGAFTGIAELLGGDGTVIDRLTTIERTMRDDFELDPGAPGAGVQRALVERFLTATRRGTSEQFVTTFVLLARSLGVDARVAAGFVLDPDDLDPDDPDDPDDTATTAVLRSDHAAVWPEVRLAGGDWVPFDPVPDRIAADAVAPPPPPQVQSPAAAQPPVAPAVAPSDPPEPDDDVAQDAARPTWLTVLGWVARAGALAALVLAPFALAIGTVVSIKARRRRRRLGVADPADRIRGAWAMATDALVDAGLGIRPSWTDGDIVAAGAVLVPGVPHELSRLGAMSSSATFAARWPADAAGRHAERARDAVAALEQIELALLAELSRWQRWRWRTSLRSLRRSTRSPVLGDTPVRRA
jgi:hypothetical protein